MSVHAAVVATALAVATLRNEDPAYKGTKFTVVELGGDPFVAASKSNPSPSVLVEARDEATQIFAAYDLELITIPQHRGPYSAFKAVSITGAVDRAADIAYLDLQKRLVEGAEEQERIAKAEAALQDLDTVIRA